MQTRFPDIDSEVKKLHLHNSNGPDLFMEGRILVQASGWALPGIWRVIQIFEAGSLLVATSQISQGNPSNGAKGIDVSIRIAEDLEELSAFLGFDLLAKQVMHSLGMPVGLDIDDLYRYQQMEEAAMNPDFVPGTRAVH